jgi:phosphoribulokinase
VTRTFENIFRREGVKAAVIEGDSFHRYDRKEMRSRQAEAEKAGQQALQPLRPENNLFPNSSAVPHYAETGTGPAPQVPARPVEAAPYKQEPGTFTPWETCPPGTDCCSTKACTAPWSRPR